MRQICAEELCTGCGACAEICSCGCIQMTADAEGFLRPQIDEAACIGCGLCEKRCPAVHAQPESPKKAELFAAVAKKEQLRTESSSGGIFSVLAGCVLQQGGIVFGAAFSKDCRTVQHISVDTAEKLALLRSSKYVQSEIGRSYREAKDYLDSGRSVLFCGTPCQIAGLKAFLARPYENLLCVDVICHGVPSAKIWRRYLDMLEERNQSKCSAVNFRDKSYGWADFRIKISFDNGTIRMHRQMADPYFRGFCANLFLRPSCYQCQFKGKNSCADITLGDFWGLHRVLSEWADNRGTTLVQVRTQQGHVWMKRAAAQMKLQQVEETSAFRANMPALKSVPENPNRAKFFEALQKESFAVLIDRLCPLRTKDRLRLLLPQKIISLVRKLKL